MFWGRWRREERDERGVFLLKTGYAWFLGVSNGDHLLFMFLFFLFFFHLDLKS